MAGFKDKIKNLFGGEGNYDDDDHNENNDNYNNNNNNYDNYEDDDYNDQYDDYYREPARPHSRNNIEHINSKHNIERRVATSADKIVSINTSVSVGVCMYNPSSIEDAAEIVEQIKDKNIVVINLETVDYSTSQRISDFLCGSSYALESTIQLISNKIMIIAPNNVEMTGDLKDKIQASGIQIPTSVWD
ncbi:MAG: cell division protein SepF [bacterium]